MKYFYFILIILVLIINPIIKVISYESEYYCKKEIKIIICEIYECEGIISNKYCSNDLRFCHFLLTYQKTMKGYKKKDWKQKKYTIDWEFLI